MARGILGEYGPDANKPQAPRARSGGVTMKDKRDVMNYKPPTGPIGITRTGVGLGGANLGNCGTQGPAPSRGDGAGGSPGLHGDDEGMGTNRGG
jgi:hypothetical protein